VDVCTIGTRIVDNAVTNCCCVSIAVFNIVVVVVDRDTVVVILSDMDVVVDKAIVVVESWMAVSVTAYVGKAQSTS
jgi:hypothetical protein